MRKRVDVTLAVILALVFQVTQLLNVPSAAASPQTRERGGGVSVGAFRIGVEVQRQRVTVKELKGKNAAAVPSTELVVHLVKSKENRVKLAVAIRNTGTRTLVAPIQAIVLKTAPPATATNADAGSGPGSWRWSYGAASLSPSELSGQRVWAFTGHNKKLNHLELEVEIRAGVPLAAGEGATINGAGGVSVTVQPNSFPYEVFLDIAPAPGSSISAPLGSRLALVAAVSLTITPTVPGTLLPPAMPLQVSIPAPAGLPDNADFIVALQAPVEVASTPPAVEARLIPVDRVVRTGERLVTQGGSFFGGILGGGDYAFIRATEPSLRGFARGVVSDPLGPLPGAVVGNNTNTFVSIAGATGEYRLFINGGPFTVTGFDPLRGSSGSTDGQINFFGTTVSADIDLTPIDLGRPMRDGIRDGGFEVGPFLFNFFNWKKAGAVFPVPDLSYTATDGTDQRIVPTEAQWMVDINTGTSAIDSIGSTISQSFIVPAGVQKLYFDYNMVSEEFPEFRGSLFNDTFRATLATPEGDTTITVSINEPAGPITPLLGDCHFADGDMTCGATGWRTASFDIPSSLTGPTAAGTVTLTFSVNDEGDNIFDTHVLIDNIRFATVWVDAKVLHGPTVSAQADRGRVVREVNGVNGAKGANDILSQAGINVRIRDVRDVSVPSDDPLDTDTNYTVGPPCDDGRVNLRQTEQIKQILALERSATATDTNVYYVRSLQRDAKDVAVGVAIGPDDFCQEVEILRNSGILLADGGSQQGVTMAHELGHLLISPPSSESILEHCSEATNFMASVCNGQRYSLAGQLNRLQSIFINRSPLLVP